MKEPYISPELKVTCFVPEEYLARPLDISAVEHLNATTNASGNITYWHPGDIFIPIPKP